MVIDAEFIRSLDDFIENNSDCPIGSLISEILIGIADRKNIIEARIDTSQFNYVLGFLESSGFKVDNIYTIEYGYWAYTFFTVEWRL